MDDIACGQCLTALRGTAEECADIQSTLERLRDDLQGGLRGKAACALDARVEGWCQQLALVRAQIEAARADIRTAQAMHAADGGSSLG